MTSSSQEDKQEIRLKKTINSGSEVVGGAGGALVGAVIGGLPGGIVAAAVVPLLTNTLKELTNSAVLFVDRKGKARTEKALKHCLELIKQKSERGEEIRTDDIFNPNLEGCSDFEEMFENIIRSVEQDTQVKKTLIYSNLMANLLFEERVDMDEIFFLIKVLKQISYLQLKIVKLLVENDIMEMGCMFDPPYHLDTDNKNVNLLSEIKQLEFLGIVKPVTLEIPSTSDEYYLEYLKKVYHLYGLDTISDPLTKEFMNKI